MKIVLTGAGGQLAKDLWPLLVKSGHGVSGFTHSELDIAERAGVLEKTAHERPGVIVNCAAFTKVDDAEVEKETAFRVNRDGVRFLAEAAGKAGATLIHISTDFVFDGLKSTPYRETDDKRPLSVYGQSKLAGEEALKGSRKHIVIRTSWLYGAHGKNFVTTILDLAEKNETLKVVYDQVSSPTWTVDLAACIAKILKAIEEGSAPGGVYHYSNEGVASRYDLATSAIEEARVMFAPLRCKRIEPVLSSAFPAPAKRPAYSVLDKEKIKKTFGMEIPHWKVSLKKMLGEFYGGKGA